MTDKILPRRYHVEAQKKIVKTMSITPDKANLLAKEAAKYFQGNISGLLNAIIDDYFAQKQLDTKTS